MKAAWLMPVAVKDGLKLRHLATAQSALQGLGQTPTLLEVTFLTDVHPEHRTQGQEHRFQWVVISLGSGHQLQTHFSDKGKQGQYLIYKKFESDLKLEYGVSKGTHIAVRVRAPCGGHSRPAGAIQILARPSDILVLHG